MRVFIYLIAALILSSCVNRSVKYAPKELEEVATRVFVVGGTSCSHGVRLQDEGPFGLLITCDGTNGTQMNVLYYDQMANEKIGRWTIDDRSWQSPLWSRDVMSYFWGRDRKTLYVSTSSVHGSGEIFKLDLFARRAYPMPIPKDQIKSASSRGSILSRVDYVERWIYFNQLDRNLDRVSEESRIRF